MASYFFQSQYVARSFPLSRVDLDECQIGWPAGLYLSLEAPCQLL